MSRHQDLLQRNSGSGEAGFTRTPERAFRESSGKAAYARLVSGFTLIEVLVAFTLLTTALVPAFIVAGNAASLSTIIRNSMVSANLAQEGIEVVRAIRDDNWFAGRAFDAGLGACTTGCAVQFDSDMPTAGALAAAPLRLDPATGLYQYDSGPDTPFRRSVTVTSAPPRMKVISEVTWKERTADKKISLEYYLFDWKQ